MSEKKILEVVTLRCPCGATVDYENTMRGAVNVGDVKRATGWSVIYDAMTASVWVCPTCAAAAVIHARALVGILHSEYVNLSSVLATESQGDRT
jgi:hypothetical protein